MTPLLCRLPLLAGGFASAVALMGCGPVEEVRSNEVAQWGVGFEAGRHAVGFKSQGIARTSEEGGRRSLTLSVWYPAEDGFEEPILLEDLYEIVLEEGQLEEAEGLSVERSLPAVMTGDSASLTAAQSLSALSAPTRAFRNAVPATGSFPLLLWSSRHATVVAQAPLAESLASQGFVVATVWSSDPPLAFPWQDRPDAEKRATVEEHADDLAAALDLLEGDATVDTGRTVLLSWSYGGQSAAVLQQREPRVRAVVSLDANVIPSPAEEAIQLRRPLVYFVGRDFEGSLGERLAGVGASWVALRLPDMAHGNFNALEGYLPALFGSDTVFAWSQGGEVAVDGYAALVRMVGEAVRTLRADSLPSMEGLADRLTVAGYPAQIELRYSDQGR